MIPHSLLVVWKCMDETVFCRWSMDYTVLESAMSWVVPPSEESVRSVGDTAIPLSERDQKYVRQ